MRINKKMSFSGPLSVVAATFAIALAAGPALAGTITVNASTPNSWDYVNIVDGSATIDGSSGPGSSTASPATTIQLQTTAGATLNAYCADLFDYIYIPSQDTFNQSALTAGASFANGSSNGQTTYGGSWTQTQVNLLNALMSNTVNLTSPVQTAALQVAVWEVEYGTMANNAYNVTGSNQNFYFTPDSSADGNSSTVLADAQTYLNNVTSGAWSYNNSYVIEYLTGGTNSNGTPTQNLIYVAAAPEPSTFAVFGLGLAAMWRARRRKRA